MHVCAAVVTKPACWGHGTMGCLAHHVLCQMAHLGSTRCCLACECALHCLQIACVVRRRPAAAAAAGQTLALWAVVHVAPPCCDAGVFPATWPPQSSHKWSIMCLTRLCMALLHLVVLPLRTRLPCSSYIQASMIISSSSGLTAATGQHLQVYMCFCTGCGHVIRCLLLLMLVAEIMRMVTWLELLLNDPCTAFL